MSFASIQFLLFLPLVFSVYYIRPTIRWQNAVSVLASYYFYGWWDYRFCALLFGTSALDYWLGARIAKTDRPAARRTLLILSLVSNLGLLGFFKYYNFFVSSLVLALDKAGLHIHTLLLNVILPAGISFYTFQSLSYTIDIYRGRLTASRDFLAYLGFVSFFPHLVAGPIQRASFLLPQFTRLRCFSYSDAVSGCRLMLWGFFKKVAVADNLAPVVDAAYNNPGSASAGQLALATVCFAFQIYGDFSGYSDMAAGMSRLFGIELSRNFAYPYFSQSIADFWRRWHISLSTWFRDYVFIPLGGSRCERGTRVRNIVVTFLLSGLWHGAAWTFVLWGALHALYLIPHHWRKRVETPSDHGMPPVVPEREGRWQAGGRILVTFVLVCFGWVLFRARNLAGAAVIYQKIAAGIFSSSFFSEVTATLSAWPKAFIVLGGLILIEWTCRTRWSPLELPSWPRAARWAVYTIIIWSILYFAPAEIQPFVYFQF